LNSEAIIDVVCRYHRDSTRRLHLVPSENTLSAAARLPFVSDLFSRYSFPAEGVNSAWPGNEDIALLERAAQGGLRSLLGAKHVNLKPVSGINAMTVAVSSLSQPGGTVLSLNEADGGHGSTRFITRQLGRHHRCLPYDCERYCIDTNALRDLVAADSMAGPIFVYLDQFMCLFPHDLAAIRSAVGQHAIICYDGSHVLGLIAGGQFQNPLAEGADVVVASTHKSFPGPHKGILATNSMDLSRRINEHAGHWVSHHHPAEVASLAICVAEMCATARVYAAQTVANAQTFARALSNRGLAVCGAHLGFTQSHQVWADVARTIDPAEASGLLLKAGIVVNAIPIPYLTSGTGLRFGVQEVTRRGMRAAEMEEIASVICGLLIEQGDFSNASRRIALLLDRHPFRGDDLLQPLVDAVHRTPSECSVS